ncbi:MULTISPECIES: helix-turn-helix domain-containing protein [unclassified Streptomyces]|uniref:TetR/AcrR family transcriptional regulator n=1 Tax=unclassified Streptomyces TaxID=2593676 RepID=UPI002E822096|nr:helix-turn-helix domain-containing protein [Streptomyces sp. NBC_00589]WTI33721.1 TetR/AcrR family transcriptional regulator [Streptomyces sp. NBC_00775]WUB32607.1 TetR/AcrR family transcriptional regulator [Streptomyces sp. NBC_00589]
MTTEPQRPLRADARRNRERILQTARTAFAAEGISVSLDEIARRAGVGPGTVHRHFATKEALFEAVVREHLEQLTLDVRAALAEAEAGPAFFAFLARMTAEADAKQDLTEAITAAGAPMGAATEEVAAQLRELFGALLARAQQAGVVRNDVDAADVQAIVVAALTASRRRGTNDRPGRLAEIVFDCLHPRHTNTDGNRA